MSDTMIAIVGSILTGILLKAGDWLINRSKDGREARKDLREEIADQWDRIDKLDAKLVEKDKEIAELRGKLSVEAFWQQRYTAEYLKTQILERKMEEMQEHISRLEVQIKELQK